MEARRRNAKGNVVTGGRRIDFLGYAFNHENTRLRKSIKQNFARRSRVHKPEKRRREILAAYWGWCKWADCRNLWNRITNHDMSFADIGITGRIETKDGKKFFDVKKVKIDSIINLPITVLDFETGITTPHGKDRYAIKISSAGNELKIITNSFTLKTMLDQAANLNALPIDTIIKKRDIGDGKSDYYFE